MDPIINEAANWHYMNGGRASVPVVFWGVIMRGGEQAAQHSQAIHAIFSHVPGLKVVMPATPYDAKGLMLAAIQDPGPVVFVDDRWLHPNEEPVPEEAYAAPIGKGAVRREGKDVTVVGLSYLLPEAIRAADELEKEGISAEVIDPRTVKPLDKNLILQSLRKTGRLVVADVGWASFGVSGEIAAMAGEEAFGMLKAPVLRVALPDCPAPASQSLEAVYYPRCRQIIDAVLKIV